MAKNDKPDETSISEIKAALAEVVRELKDDRPAAVQVGRTPSDAVTEVTGNLFRLLGQWTTPILLLVLLAVGWYFLQAQNQKVDTEYQDSLALLRQERDEAYDRVSDFSGQMATVSGQQIKNLTDAFESLKKINTESATRQSEALAFQQQAEDARAELSATQANLTQARTVLQQQREDLKASEARLEDAEDKLEDRVEEVERKERALGVRGGTIGELQDTLRDYQGVSTDYIAALQQLALAMEEEDRDAVAVASMAAEADRLEDAFQKATQRVRDTVTDANAVLSPLADFSVEISSDDVADQLIGYSATRFMELVEPSNGFGFDFWRRYLFDGEDVFFGIASNQNGLFRVVILTVEIGPDGNPRIVDTTAGNAAWPTIGPSLSNGWQSSIFIPTFYEQGLEMDDVSWMLDPDVDSVRMVDLLGAGGKVSELNFQFGASDELKVLSQEEYDALLADDSIPSEVRSKLRLSEELKLVLAMAKERENGADAWRQAINAITNDELRERSEDILTIAQRGILGATGLRIPSGATRVEFGELAAVMLQPDLIAEFAIGARQFEFEKLSPGQLSELPRPTEIPENWYQDASVTLRAGNGEYYIIEFTRDSTNGAWRFDRFSAW
ncbi:hypothetical protein [uncultured Litoreibacter sp.]|uniref:hypothetical protein n=1 Tax=uncultured Litoreibacter sp. TaxID=1392394 RepID=UPI002634E4B3|nr:hypothetical protein [uncultured Litoreibacter sp.]